MPAPAVAATDDDAGVALAGGLGSGVVAPVWPILVAMTLLAVLCFFTLLCRRCMWSSTHHHRDRARLASLISGATQISLFPRSRPSMRLDDGSSTRKVKKVPGFTDLKEITLEEIHGVRDSHYDEGELVDEKEDRGL